MDEYSQYEQRILDITRDANFALWNALLTLNGIFISVFSAVAVFSPATKGLALLIISVSMLSALLLILNFRSIRNQYRFMGEAGIDGAAKLTPKQKEQQIDASARLHRNCNVRERTAHGILTIQAVLILTLVFLKST